MRWFPASVRAALWWDWLKATAGAYVLLAIAAVLRVFGPITAMDYEWTLRVSGALWIAAFALLLAVYAPILLRPRIDGRPG